MIKGVIFDIDGVLLDSMIIWTDLGERYLKSIGKEPEEGLTEKLFSMSMEQGAEYLKDKYNIDESVPEILDDINNISKNFYYNEVEAKPGVKELLEDFSSRGIKMVAATSSPRGHVERALTRVGLLEFIDRIFTNGEVGVSKHEPDIYNLAAEHMGTAHSETLVFEDSLYALKTAKSAGYVTVGIHDARGEKDQAGLKENAELYLKGYDDLSGLMALL
ncbi:MAG: HAD family phosphatase [Eubacterium sp.]|nr:HAD family phosphatase [Eubacterium sp.]